MDAMQVEKAVKALGDKPTLKNFIKQFGVFAQGPGGLKILKRLILKLAVKGELIELNISDSKIDKIVLSSINSLIEDKVIKKLKFFPEYKEIKYGWYETTLNGLGYWALGTGFPKKYQGETDKDILFVKVSDMNLEGNEKYITKSVNTIDNDLASKMKAKIHDIGTVIFPKIGGAIATNKRRIITKKTAIDNNCLGITAYSGVSVEWLYITLLSIDMESYQAGTSVPALSQSTLEKIKVGLPDVKEQKCIVAKVDELMALCDQLQAQQQQQANTLLKANTAAIHALLSAESGQATKQKTDKQQPKNKKSLGSRQRLNDKDSFNQAWQRIANNFHSLYGNTLPMPPGEGRQKKYFVGLENVKQLRKCIFKLAVSGYLTARGNDSASNDLNKILKTRKQLEAAKKVKKYIAHNGVPNNEQGIAIPESWEFTKLGCITDISSGSTPLKGKLQYYEDGEIPWVTSSATSNEFIYSSDVLISEVAVKECSLTLYKPGTLLMAMYGQGKTRGQVAELKISATINQACAAISFFEQHENIRPYIKIVLWKLYDEIRELADGGAQPNLNGIKVKATLIPFPPLEEQKRIVAKVDQLMAHCEKLEQQLTTAYGDAEKLINTTIKSLVA